MNLRLAIWQILNDRYFFSKRFTLGYLRSLPIIVSEIVLAFLLIPFAIVAWFSKWRFADIYHLRIGHQIAEYIYVTNKFPEYKLFSIATGEAANDYVLSRYQIPVVRNIIVGGLLRSLFWWPFLRVNVEDALRTDKLEAYKHPEYFSKVFDINRKEIADLEILLARLCVAKPYVCLHVRTVGYSESDDARFLYRNGDLSQFSLLVSELEKLGLTCVLVGGSNKNNLRSAMNYSNSNCRSPYNDFLLIAGAAWFIGNTSGLYLLAAALGVPTILTDVIPEAHRPLFKDIPFLLRPLKRSKKLSSSEEEKLYYASDSEIFKELGVEVLNHSPNEILNFIQPIICNSSVQNNCRSFRATPNGVSSRDASQIQILQ